MKRMLNLGMGLIYKYCKHVRTLEPLGVLYVSIFRLVNTES